MARVRVDTPNSLDKDWKLGIMKSSVEPPPELRKILANLVPNIVGDSKRVVLRRGAKVAASGTPAWQFREIGPNLFALEVNRDHPLLQALTEVLSKDQIATLDLFISQLEAGVPSEELVSRLSSDQAPGTNDLNEESLKDMARLLYSRLRSRYGSASEALETINNLEPFSTNPFARELLLAWSDQLEIEVADA
jgi:hypothetical protein